MNIDEIMSLANTYARLIVRGSDEEVHDSYHKLQAAITQHVAEAVAAEADGWRGNVVHLIAEAVEKEKEACVAACKSVVDAGPENGCCPTYWNEGAEACEAAIRARAEKETT